MSSFLNFLYTQLFVTLPTPTERQDGKTIIVTGSNVGLGKEAARHFARLNASKIILAVRDTAKGEAAARDIIQSTSCSPSAIEVWQLDLSSYASVLAFADRATKLDRLDKLLSNAGIATEEFKLFEDNESTLTVNVVSTFLHALLLLPKLKETAQKYNTRPSLTIVSSEVHGWTPFTERHQTPIFPTLNDPKKANMTDRYPLSKLLEVLTVREWARLHPALEYPITINFVNPGLCHSELTREGNWGVWLLKKALARTTEAGSRTLVNAVAEQGPETHGMYLSDCKVAVTAPLTLGDEGGKLSEKVWGELKEKLEKISPGVTSNL